MIKLVDEIEQIKKLLKNNENKVKKGNMRRANVFCVFCGNMITISRRGLIIHGDKYISKESKWNGEYICNDCKKETESYRGKVKLGVLDPYGRYATGYITEKLISKFYGIDTCADITDKLNYPGYDLINEDLERLQSKGSTLLAQKNFIGWQFNINKNKKCDIFVCICYDAERKNVLRIYFVPNEKWISDKRQIKIGPNDEKYMWYRETKENEKLWNDLFHCMNIDECPAMKNFNNWRM